jgi:protein-tyrosine-phosphatase
VQKLTLETLRRNGYPVEALDSKAIGQAEWAAADLVINMSGYSKQRTFPHTDWQKVEDWDVEDPYGSDPAVYQRTFEDIQTRIDELATRLRKRQT